MRRTSLRKTSEIRAYLDKGLSVRQVADLTGVCKTTVHKYKQEHIVAPCTHRGGRPRKLTGRMSRTVIRKIENGQFRDSREVVKYLNDCGSLNVGIRKVQSHLNAHGLYSYSRQKKAYLSDKHTLERRRFYRAYKTKPIEFWQNVIFSDEKKFNLFGSNAGPRVYCKPGSPILKHHVRGVRKFGGGGVMVWGAITYKGVGKLHILQGKVDAKAYVEILNTSYLSTVAEANLDSTKATFQQDIAPIHTSQLTKKWLSEHRIQTLNWPRVLQI